MCEQTQLRKGPVQTTINLLAVLFLLVVAANAQLTISDNLKMHMSGNLGYGYNGAFGNFYTSSSSTGIVGNADLNGYYFHPNFLSFDVRPYFDRNRASSESQTLTIGKGLGANVNVFTGSRFPGTVSFSQGFANNTEFRVAGVPSVSGDSSSTTFGVTWSALIPDLPKVTARFATSSGNANFLDTYSSESSSKTLSLNSTYDIAGFNLAGTATKSTNHFTSPAVLTFEDITNDNTTTTFSASAQRQIPLHGSLSLNWNRAGSSSNGGNAYTTSNYSASATFTPWNPFSFYQNVVYTKDLTGAYAQEVAGNAAFVAHDGESNGIFYSTGASLRFGYGFTVSGRYSYRIRNLIGREYRDSQYGGDFNYSRSGRLFGLIYFGASIIDTASKSGNEGMGFNGVVGMNKKFKGWDTSADFTYAHNVQTLLSIVNTSNYTYGGNVRRKLSEDLRVGFNFRASHSAMVAQEGSGNRAESYSGSLAWRRYTFTGAYSQSSGTSVFSNTGELTPTPVGSIISPEFLLYDARSYSVSMGTSLFRRLSVTGGYARYNSNSESVLADRLITGNRFNARAEYRLRKFTLISGYNRSMQDISTITGGPRIVNSYYVSISRWFNVF